MSHQDLMQLKREARESRLAWIEARKELHAAEVKRRTAQAAFRNAKAKYEDAVKATKTVPEPATPKVEPVQKPSGLAKRVFNEGEAAKYLSLSRSALASARTKEAKGFARQLRFVKMGRSVRYLKEDLDQFLNSSRVNLSGEASNG